MKRTPLLARGEKGHKITYLLRHPLPSEGGVGHIVVNVVEGTYFAHSGARWHDVTWNSSLRRLIDNVTLVQDISNKEARMQELGLAHSMIRDRLDRMRKGSVRALHEDGTMSRLLPGWAP